MKTGTAPRTTSVVDKGRTIGLIRQTSDDRFTAVVFVGPGETVSFRNLRRSDALRKVVFEASKLDPFVGL